MPPNSDSCNGLPQPFCKSNDNKFSADRNSFPKVVVRGSVYYTPSFRGGSEGTTVQKISFSHPCDASVARRCYLLLVLTEG